MAAVILGAQEVLTHVLQGVLSTQASSTVQASPAPTTSTFSVASGSFRQGEALITNAGVAQGVYISAVSGTAITINPPLAAAPAVGATVEQDIPQYTAPVTGNGNGIAVDAAGYNGAQTVEIVNTGTGTCTVNIEGSNGTVDGSGNPIWYAMGYQQVDGVAAPARSVTAIAVTAGLFAHSYQVLDLYRSVRARISGTAGTISVSINLVAVPA